MICYGTVFNILIFIRHEKYIDLLFSIFADGADLLLFSESRFASFE